MSWPLAASCVAAVVAMNAAWHAWLRDVPGSHEAFIVLATATYLVLLRRFLGVGFGALSRRSRVVIVTATLLVVVLLAFGRAGTFERHLAELVPPGPLSLLYPFFYFAGASVLLRTIVPLLLIHGPLGDRASDYGYRLRGSSRLGWAYLALFLLSLPVVIWVSSHPDFQASYPQAKSATHRDVIPWGIFMLYHALYFLVFLSGESFWRGYMTFGLGRELGLNALPWMAMVYSVVHYGKPWLEVNGAVVTGFVLGFLALRHGSFWLGVLLHWSIALAMDLAVIGRTEASIDWGSVPW